MRRWDPLTERQATLLRRIGDGDDLSGADGVAQRTSARSLQNRGLVEVSRRDGSWRATVTDAGRFYLHHGHHPEDPDRRPPDAEQPPAPPPKRPLQAGSRQPTSKASGADSAAAGPLVEQARELIGEVRRDGTLRLEAPDADTRARYRRMIHAAKQYNLVPEGFHLKHTGRASGDLIIRLSDDAAPDETDWNRVRLNTRRVTTDPSLVFAALEKDPAGLDVAEASVPRALELIRSLAEEARRRGHRVGVNTKTKHPKVYVQLGQTRRTLTVHEEYDDVPHVPTDQERRARRRSPWLSIPETDKVPSGRLRLEIGRAGWNTQDSWTDNKRSPLEKRLTQILRDAEAGLAADEEARESARRAHEKYLAERRREEDEQRRQWQETLTAARPKAVDALRKKTFRTAYDEWISAGEVRAFCDALEAAEAGGHDGDDHRAYWIRWARAEADRLDPTRGQASLAGVDFDIEPRPDDLRPYLGKWSPHEPRHEYRYERDQSRLDEARQAADSWHHGMRGQHAWWRHR